MLRMFPILVLLSLFIPGAGAFGENAYKIKKKTVTMKSLREKSPGQFYDIEKKRYELVENMAYEEYIDAFFADLAKKDKTTPEKAREKYMKSRVKVSDDEIAMIEKSNAGNKQLAAMSKSERKREITNYLLGFLSLEIVGNRSVSGRLPTISRDRKPKRSYRKSSIRVLARVRSKYWCLNQSSLCTT